MTEQQRKDQLETLVRRDNIPAKCHESKGSVFTASVYLDPDLNWLCKDCPYAKECETMRAAGAVA